MDLDCSSHIFKKKLSTGKPSLRFPYYKNGFTTFYQVSRNLDRLTSYKISYHWQANMLQFLITVVKIVMLSFPNKMFTNSVTHSTEKLFFLFLISNLKE